MHPVTFRRIHRNFLILCLISTVALTTAAGCSLFWKPVAAGQDAVLVNVQRADQTAWNTIATFLQIDSENHDFFKAQIPAAHAFAESLRQKDPTTGKSRFEMTFDALKSAEAAYATKRDSDTAAGMNTALSTVENLMQQARSFMLTWEAMQGKKTDLVTK